MQSDLAQGCGAYADVDVAVILPDLQELQASGCHVILPSRSCRLAVGTNAPTSEEEVQGRAAGPAKNLCHAGHLDREAQAAEDELAAIERCGLKVWLP